MLNTSNTKCQSPQEELVKKLITDGANLFVAKNKIPASPSWSSKKGQSETEIINALKSNKMIGWALNKNIIVIDVDVKNNNPGLESFKKLEADLNVKLEPPHTETPSGGFHLYYSVNDEAILNLRKRKTLKNYPGIDFLSKGQFVIIFGNGYVQKRQLVDINPIPKQLVNVLFDKYSQHETMTGNTLSPSDVYELLLTIKPEEYYDWVTCGMAIHSEWPDKTGLGLWTDWSAKSSKFKNNDTVEKWKTFKHMDYGVKLGTLIHMAQNEKKNPEINPEIIPECLKPWIWVNSREKFYNVHSKVFVSEKGFNMALTPIMPYIPSKSKNAPLSPYNYAKTRKSFIRADILRYAPGREAGLSILENEGGLIIWNTFDKTKMCKPDAFETKDGANAINAIKNHIYMLFGREPNRSGLFIDWIAHNIQNPGVKIRWAPLIQGIQGVGKSFLGALLKKMMGNENVGSITPAMVNDQWSEWLTGKCVNILEELKISGVNRSHGTDKLKPAITDPWVTISQKHIDSRIEPNTTNYICFTNFKNAVPLTVNDRRWWVIQTPMQTTDDLETATNGSKQWFDNLWSCLHKQSGQIARWLHNHKISDDFKSHITAPKTSEREIVIRTEDSAWPEIQSLGELMEKGSSGEYNLKMIVQCALRRDYEDQNAVGVGLTDKYWFQLLRKMDFQNIGRFRIDSEKKRIWSILSSDANGESWNQKTVIEFLNKPNLYLR